MEGDDRCDRDISDYITTRYSTSPQISSNTPAQAQGQVLPHLTDYIVRKAGGCFLYVKLLLDYIERGHLVIKSDSFKLLPHTLAEIYQLAFNLIFPSATTYEPVSTILSICLAALQPLTLPQLFCIFSAQTVSQDLTWEHFLTLYQSIAEFLVMRNDGSLMFRHPTLRDWLSRRRPVDSSKFLCNVKKGHSCIAFYLVRLPSLSTSHKALELAHHVLKANVHKKAEYEMDVSYKDLQAFFLSLSQADISAALGSTKNIFSPLLRVSQLLLLAGANPNYLTDYHDRCPLLAMYALLGNKDMVTLLLEHGADANTLSNNGTAPLSFACASGNLDIAKLLLSSGADADHVDDDGECALVAAARAGHLHIVKFLLGLPRSPIGVGFGVEAASCQALVAAAENKQVKVGFCFVKFLWSERNYSGF